MVKIKYGKSIIVIFTLVLIASSIYYKIKSNSIIKENELQSEIQPILFSADAYIVKPTTENSNDILRGSIYADKNTYLVAAASGIIKYENISNGSDAKEGQCLIRIDDEILQQNLQQKYKELKNAKINNENLQLLFQNHNATKVEVSDSKLKLKAIFSEIDIIQHQIQLSNLKAPISGIITEIKHHKGEYISQGESIATITNLNSLLVKIYISQSSIQKYTIGKPFAIIPDSELSDTIMGSIESILPIASDAGSYPMNIRILRPSNIKLLEGMTITALDTNKKSKCVIKIPRVAIINHDNQTYVYVYHKNRHPILKEIEIANCLTSWVVVQKGLNVGDTLITNNQTNINSHNILQKLDYRTDY